VLKSERDGVRPPAERSVHISRRSARVATFNVSWILELLRKTASSIYRGLGGSSIGLRYCWDLGG